VVHPLYVTPLQTYGTEHVLMNLVSSTVLVPKLRESAYVSARQSGRVEVGVAGVTGEFPLEEGVPGVIGVFPLEVGVPGLTVFPLEEGVEGVTGVFPFVAGPLGESGVTLSLESGVTGELLESVTGLPLLSVPSEGGFPVTGPLSVVSVLGVELGIVGSTGTWVGMEESKVGDDNCSTSRLTDTARGQTRMVVGVAVFFAYKQTTEGRVEPEQKEKPHPK
jgi:hypothetical protein